MVDIAAGFGIDQRHAGLAVEMTGVIGEPVGEGFEDRGIDLDPVDVLGAEKQRGKDVATTADAYDSDVSRRLHQIGGIDDVVLEVGELAKIAIVPGNDGCRIRVDIEVVLVYFCLRRAGKSPTERSAFPKRRDPHARVGIPPLEQRSHLLLPLGPEDAQMAFPGNIKAGLRNGCGSQRKRNGAAQAQAAGVAAAPHDRPTCTGGEGSDPECSAYRIDDEQYEDDPDTSKASASNVGP